MKKSDIYEIAIKILGLYLFLPSIGLLSDVLSTMVIITQPIQKPDELGYDQTPYFILSIANFVFVILFAAFLTFKTKAIVKFVCKPTDYEETTSLFADRIVIYELALLILGLILVVWTLPDFALKLYDRIQFIKNGLETTDYQTDFIITSAFRIVVGLVAVIYAKSIATILIRDNKNGKTE